MTCPWAHGKFVAGWEDYQKWKIEKTEAGWQIVDIKSKSKKSKEFHLTSYFDVMKKILS